MYPSGASSAVIVELLETITIKKIITGFQGYIKIIVSIMLSMVCSVSCDFKKINTFAYKQGSCS